jgi:hypothetical protein
MWMKLIVVISNLMCNKIGNAEGNSQMAVRKSTPKYEVVTFISRAVVFGPASKTDCDKMARSMNIKGRAASVHVVPVKKGKPQ